MLTQKTRRGYSDILCCWKNIHHNDLRSSGWLARQSSNSKKEITDLGVYLLMMCQIGRYSQELCFQLSESQPQARGKTGSRRNGKTVGRRSFKHSCTEDANKDESGSLWLIDVTLHPGMQRYHSLSRWKVTALLFVKAQQWSVHEHSNEWCVIDEVIIDSKSSVGPWLEKHLEGISENYVIKVYVSGELQLEGFNVSIFRVHML